MKEVFNVGNLPLPFQVMAKEVMGQKSTLFFECESANELLNFVKDQKAEETTVIIDRKNDKGFITAFGFTDSNIEDLSGDKLVTMKVYFAQIENNEIKEYATMLDSHRKQQEQAHKSFNRRSEENKHRIGDL